MKGLENLKLPEKGNKGTNSKKAFSNKFIKKNHRDTLFGNEKISVICQKFELFGIFFF